MRARPVFLCLSILVCSFTAQAGFAISPIQAGGGDAAGIGPGPGTGPDSGMGMFDSSMTSENRMDFSAGGSGSMDMNVEIVDPRAVAGSLPGAVDPNLVGERTGTSFFGETSGGVGMDMGSAGSDVAGTGIDMGGMGSTIDSGMPSFGLGAGDSGIIGTGSAGMGFDAQAAGAGAGLIDQISADTGMGMDMTGATEAGTDTGMGGIDMGIGGGSMGEVATGSRGAVAAGVPDRVRVETGPQEPGTKEANEAATLLRGLMQETAGFDAASEPTAPGAVEPHSMIAGPPGDSSETQPAVTGELPKGAIIRTTKEEKSTFSVSGESSFETFSSTNTGSGHSDSSLVDLNPIAAGANVIDSGRGMKDFQGEGAAATAVDTSKTDTGAAGVEKSAAGTIDASVTGPDSGSVDVSATGTGTDMGSLSGAVDMTATSAGVDSADLGAGMGVAGDVTGTGGIDATGDVGAGMGVDMTGGTDTGPMRPADMLASGTVDATGEAGAAMGVDMTGGLDLGSVGTGEARVLLPDGRTQTVHDTGIGSVDMLASGTADAPGETGDMLAGGTVESSATEQTGTADISGMGIGEVATGFIGTGTISGVADSSMTGASGATLDISGTGQRETTVSEGSADLGAAASVADKQTRAETPGSVNIDLQGPLGTIAGIKTTGAVDIKLKGPGDTAAEIHTAGTQDTVASGDVGVTAGQTKTITAGEFGVTLTEREGGKATVIRGDKDVSDTGVVDGTGDTGVADGPGVLRGTVSGGVDSTSTTDVSASGRREMGSAIDAAAGVVDLTPGDRGRSVTDRRVFDALSKVTGQMEGTIDTGAGATSDITGTETFGVGANVLDREAGFRDFPSSSDAASSVVERRITGTGTTGGIFGWRGEADRLSETRASGDVSMTGEGSRTVSTTAGGVSSDGSSTMRGGLATSMTGDISGRASAQREGTMSLGQTGSMTDTKTDRGTAFGMEGTRSTSMTGDMTGEASGQRGGTVSFGRTTSMTGDMTGEVSGQRGGAVSFGRSTSMTGGMTGEVSGQRGDSFTGEGRGSLSGSLERDSSFGMGVVGGGVSGSGTTGAGSFEGSLTGSRTGSGTLSIEGTRRTGSLEGSRTRSGSMSLEGAGTVSGTGTFEGRLKGGMTGGIDRGMGVGMRKDGFNNGKGSAMLSLEERTIRQGEWSATWNYEGQVPEWFRHRVDPAPCRQYGCNLASCYVPNPNDCKSYIVCQRTALGTYVATRMRCAFGTYWTPSNIWTCERITDENVLKFNCPNDPCRLDPNLQRYPDEDFDNCKSFWTCRNGRSMPECCPPGQRFNRDRLSCENDPEETCRKQCPLKQEACLPEGPTKQPVYDGNCLTYFDCGKHGAPHPVCCPDGQSFEPGTGTCVETGCRDICPPEYNLDVCGKVGKDGQIIFSYPMRDNCRAFIKCDPMEGRIVSCCRADYFYNERTMKCEKIQDPLDPCRLVQCPEGFQEECRFGVVPEDPRLMFDIDAGIVRNCSLGTVFDPKICTCVFSNEPARKVCRKEVDAKFDHINDKWSVYNYGDGFISSYKEMIKNATKNGNHYATFDGTTGMAVWRYDHNKFKEFTLKITFQPSTEVGPNGNLKQVLSSNCMTTEQDGAPSFELTLDPATSMITFTGRTDTETSVVELQYNKKGWNTYTLLFDGENVLAMIEDPKALGKADSSSTKLKGELRRGMGPLVFGPCKGDQDKANKNGFVGFMTEVIFAKCLDEASKLFMQETLASSLGPGM